MSFRHRLILGVTGQGKTWLAKRLATRLRLSGAGVIAYSGVGDRDWPPGSLPASSADELEALLKSSAALRAHVFIDEAPILYAEATRRGHPLIHSLTTAGRHRGQTAWLTAQVPTRIDWAIRQQCGEVWSFRLGNERTARQIEEDFQLPDGTWRALLTLAPLHGLHFKTGAPPAAFRLA